MRDEDEDENKIIDENQDKENEQGNLGHCQGHCLHGLLQGGLAGILPPHLISHRLLHLLRLGRQPELHHLHLLHCLLPHPLLAQVQLSQCLPLLLPPSHLALLQDPQLHLHGLLDLLQDLFPHPRPHRQQPLHLLQKLTLRLFPQGVWLKQTWFYMDQM